MAEADVPDEEFDLDEVDFDQLNEDDVEAKSARPRRRAAYASKVSSREQRDKLRDHFASGSVPAGRLRGLPELRNDEAWVDVAGASALAEAEPKTITSWLARRGPAGCPFPNPTRINYRLYWPERRVRLWVYRRGLQQRGLQQHGYDRPDLDDEIISERKRRATGSSDNAQPAPHRTDKESDVGAAAAHLLAQGRLRRLAEEHHRDES